MMVEQTDTDVAIIGAGSTGLLLAQGLKAAGIPFRIFERHGKDHVSREWSMSLHWGGEFLTTVLPPSLRDRLHEINTDPGHDFSSESGFVQCNGETGEIIMIMPGTMPRRVSRRKLRALMSEGLDIEYGKALTDVILNDPETATPSVTATFSDNNTLTSRILIGCDGSRSRVRQILLNDDAASSPAPTPYTILNFPYTYPASIVPELRAIHSVFKVSYHPKLNCMYMLSVLDTTPPSANPGDVTFQNLLSWRGPPYASDVQADPSLALKRLRELGAQFAPPFRTAAANVRDEAILFVDQGMQWDPRPHFTVSAPSQTSWNGRSFAGAMTLAGDAAHSMLPHRGQGLNHALEDAARLVAGLTAVFKEGRVSLRDAVAGYEEEMVRRGGGEVEMTAKAAMAGHDWEMLRQGPMFRYGANKPGAK